MLSMEGVMLEDSTYFLPRHPLGPKLNGCDASFISVHSGSVQRSGSNEYGSWKFRASWVTVHAEVYISACYCIINHSPKHVLLNSIIRSGLDLLLRVYISHQFPDQ
jgi:hypothetical protein